MAFHEFADAWLVMLGALVMALVLDVATVWLRPLAQLVALPGRLGAGFLAGIERRLNRPHRGAATLRTRGAVMIGTILLAIAVLGWAITELGAAMPKGGVLLEMAVLAGCFCVSPLTRAAQRFAALSGVARGELLLPLVQPFAARDALLHDRHGLARALMEALGAAGVSHLTAPLLGYALFGLPGALAMRFFAAAAHAWHGGGEQVHFAASALQVWRGLAWLPALMTSSLLALAAAMVPATRALAAWLGWWLYGAKEDGPLAVMAYATGTALGGPKHKQPSARSQWLGNGTARPTGIALRAAARLLLASRFLMLLGLGMVAWQLA